MKRIYIFLLSIILVITLSACNTSKPVIIDHLNIYYLNDLHGAIEYDSLNDQIGLTRIGNYLNIQQSVAPDNTIILAGGDMLQGSALSNYYMGLSTIELMNLMHFDAFTLGNHEFDWGLETVTAYFDGDDSNGEADFPLLSANTYYKDTTTNPDYIDPYTIIERGDLKIGIIGTMGYNLEYSIAASRINPYEFGSPSDILADLVYELRVDNEVDVVILVAHDSGNINDYATSLTGDYKIDAIFNAHSHNEYTDSDAGIPITQSGANGEYIGVVTLNIDEQVVTSFDSRNITLGDSQYLNSEDADVLALLNTYKAETDPIFNDPLITAGTYLSSGELTSWLADLMRIRTGADVAIHNSGGTRTSINPDEVITLSTLYSVWPFDNVVKTVKLPGDVVASLIQSFGVTQTSTDISYFDPDLYYIVATNDYVFDKDYNPFLYGDDIVNTGILLRDLAQYELELQGEVYDYFYTSNAILTETTPVYND